MALNPITFTERVVDDFLHYQLSTYHLADPDLQGQLRDLLCLVRTRDTPLRKGPFISLSRPFKAGARIEDLVADGVFHPSMNSVVPFPSLRAHQEEAIRAIHRGDTTLVSTGTGSGKTEAFLYPIISRCLELQEQGAAPGVVAVLIYPMNALAEDQLDRLRGLLAGRGIPFGMYVGKTPEEESQVQGRRLSAGTTNATYREQLRQIREKGQTQTLLPPEERASRAAMRRAGGQPRILLTNVKQLELLLTRGKDVGIFAGAPLEYLVFDEAHTFRGAQGAETACLIRRLRTFCGCQAENVRHVATSATMADPHGGEQAAQDFARRFFGVAGDRVTLIREQYDEQRWNPMRSVPDGPPADHHAVLNRLLEAVEASDEDVAEAISGPLQLLGGARLPRQGWQAALSAQLASNELVYQLANSLSAPRALVDLPEELGAKLGRGVSEAEVLAWLALGAATGRGGQEPLLRPVAHSFVKGISGAVATFSNPSVHARLWLSGEDADAEFGDEFWRFPVVTCTTCGQHYYETSLQDFNLVSGSLAGPTGGDLVGHDRVWPHLPEALGGRRVLFIDRLVSTPDEDAGDPDPEGEGEENGDAGEDPGQPSKRLHPLYLCRHCGSMHEQSAEVCAACSTPGVLFPVMTVRQKEAYPGLLHSCVACQAPGRRPGGGRYREPIRRMRAVSVSDVHVLAQSMIHLIDPPRLLVFADNRQDAAFQAGWMQDHARRFRLRALMAQQIAEGGTALGDVVYALDALLEADVELSRALIPEVWQVAPFYDSTNKHREERLYYLRIQLLREIASGVKQRIGLEPWGRLRLDYQGLDAHLPFVQNWALILGVTPDSLAVGIGALLDHLRRIRILHDGSTHLFDRIWTSADKEINYGYFPTITGGPKGVKLLREELDNPGRVVQWMGSRPTQIRNAVAAWGVPPEALPTFLTELWETLQAVELLVPVTLTGWGRPLTGCAGVLQVNSSKLTLSKHAGRFRCDVCRRTTVRQGPSGQCLAWHCGGRLVWEDEATDDFDLRMLDGDYEMLRAAEHSAQVPSVKREKLENQFKGDGRQLNTLVCTPTLELGVDIGALDAVLMRNVPPSAANYWQRAGRAGRRHRMAVDLTYAQATGFDQAYYRDPLRLLGGQVEPPRFNLRNGEMVRKHVHATVLTALHGIARQAAPAEGAAIEECLKRCFPPTLRSYLFDTDGSILSDVRDVTELGDMISAHRAEVVAAVDLAFSKSWPVEDADVVTATTLEDVMDQMHLSLEAVLKRFKRRLEWARRELARLSDVKQRMGGLDPEDKAHEKRCEKVIARLKGTTRRGRESAQGGGDDAETMGALAREGFLPGYGLESGTIVGTAEAPRLSQGLDDFELPRAPTLALREYVPGNVIYANSFRFVPRRYQLMPDETLRFRVDPAQQVVLEAGLDQGTRPLAAQEIRAVPVCDVIMPSQSQISDEEEFRFQMATEVFGYEKGIHRGGVAWTWGGFDLRIRRGVELRLVNVGPRKEVSQSRLGFPLCLACGQSLSPFSSQAARDEFDRLHRERCGHEVRPTGFFADVEVDVLGIHDVEDRRQGLSVGEALRMGAARVLDMEVEDLQLMAIGRAGETRWDVLLYDPMPGGSGLLEQISDRWPEVVAAAIELLETCQGACETACIDCLHTYRNRFYHEFLNRHVGLEALKAGTGPLVRVHDIPELQRKVVSTTGQAQTHIEARMKRYLSAAGLPDPICQHPIDLGMGYGRTVVDLFYAGEEDEPGLCLYTDGMGERIHGNADQAAKDAAIRARLESRGYEVVVIRSFELDDREAVVSAIARIGKYLMGREKQREIKQSTAWFDEASNAVPERPSNPSSPPSVLQTQDGATDYELGGIPGRLAAESPGKGE